MMKHARLTTFTCSSIERRLSCVTSSSLTWSDRGTIEPATLTEATSMKAWERSRVPKRTDSDLSGLRDSKLWQHQVCMTMRQSSRRWIWLGKLDGKREMQSCVSSAYCCWGTEKVEAREAIWGGIDAEKKRAEKGNLGNTNRRLATTVWERSVR